MTSQNGKEGGGGEPKGNKTYRSLSLPSRCTSVAIANTLTLQVDGATTAAMSRGWMLSFANRLALLPHRIALSSFVLFFSLDLNRLRSVCQTSCMSV
jgi:hypothetical protein